jgi:hypothetical protein
MVIESGVTSAELLDSLSIVLSTLLKASLSFSPFEDLSLLMTADTDSHHGAVAGCIHAQLSANNLDCNKICEKYLPSTNSSVIQQLSFL